MTSGAAVMPDAVDDAVDDEIAKCLDLQAPVSFFLFAGAGSGKTRSLVKALVHLQQVLGSALKARGQRVAVITYTNAASEEIKRRLLFDPLIDVRTIHSFAWTLIQGLDKDIKRWIQARLETDIATLQTEDARIKRESNASVVRKRRIASKLKRLQNLPQVTKFTYSPNGENRGRDALNHSEVLQLAAHFLSEKAAMRSILCGRFPVLLIDESQDTNRALIDALFSTQTTNSARFLLGLFGDTMQRIYNDGKEGLGNNLPATWAKPSKRLNHRCPRRIVQLINAVRKSVDGQQQIARSDAIEGVVRLFVLPSSLNSKLDAEGPIRAHMAKETGEPSWNDLSGVKTLVLEHRMAAVRLGFEEAFSPLYGFDGWRTGLLDGRLSIVQFFAEDIASLLDARRKDDRFAVARVLKSNSPLLTAQAMRSASDKGSHLRAVNDAVDALASLWDKGGDPTLRQVLQCVATHNLLDMPDVLREHAAADRLEDDGTDETLSDRDEAVRAYLAAPFSQVRLMSRYLKGEAPFDTHQGVKGLEFDHVMVVMDDSAARGFNFKYEQLFGVTSPGTVPESTKRLFYVTTSRARRSLALVAYSSDPDRVRQFVLSAGWFSADEIVMKPTASEV